MNPLLKLLLEGGSLNTAQMAQILKLSEAELNGQLDALKKDGVLAIWAAQDDRKFEQQLRDARFNVQVHHPRGRLKKGGPRHTIFLSRKID